MVTVVNYYAGYGFGCTIEYFGYRTRLQDLID